MRATLQNGDKTFFIAALLAMRLGKLPVLIGGTSALAVMTIISVALGRIFQKIPTTVTTSVRLLGAGGGGGASSPGP